MRVELRPEQQRNEAHERQERGEETRRDDRHRAGAVAKHAHRAVSDSARDSEARLMVRDLHQTRVRRDRHKRIGAENDRRSSWRTIFRAA
jgi:hypothetical protein